MPSARRRARSARRHPAAPAAAAKAAAQTQRAYAPPGAGHPAGRDGPRRPGPDLGWPGASRGTRSSADDSGRPGAGPGTALLAPAPTIQPAVQAARPAGQPIHSAGGTAHAAGRAQPHLPRVLRAPRDAPHDQQGPARQRRLRLLEHRPARLRRTCSPTTCMCCFDVGRSFRADRFADYKATRRPTPDDLRDQFPIVRETLARLPHPDLRAGGLRGRRPHRLADAPGGAAQGLESIIVSGDLDMLQLVTERTKLMTTRMGVAVDGHLRPGAHRRALRPGARPDDRLQGAQGRHDRQHPGHPRRRRQDRRASCSSTSARSRASTRDLDEVKPDKLREKLARAPRRRPALARARDHRPATRPSSSTSSAARLGDYDRAEVIRLFREYEFRTLVERLPGRRGRGRAGARRAAARGRPARAGAGGARARAGPAADRASRGGEGQRPPADARLRGGRHGGRGRGVRRRPSAPPAGRDSDRDGRRGHCGRPTIRARDCGPSSPTRALVEPFGAGSGRGRLAGRPARASSVGVAFDDPRPRRGDAARARGRRPRRAR